MIIGSITILVFMLALSFVTLVAFSQAASTRQFDDLQDSAEVIFDPDEPVGTPTDPNLTHRNNENKKV